MQIGNLLIPFTKPSSPVIWVRPYHTLSVSSKDDGAVVVRTAARRFSAASIGSYILIAAGLSLIVVPLILGAISVFSSVVDGDAAENPCDFYSTSEYIEFDDVGIMCLEFKENWSVDSFERAEEHFRYQSEWAGFEEYRWSQSGDVITLCIVDREFDQYYCDNVIRVQGTLTHQNLSYYSIYGGIPQDTPSWVNDRPSSLSVDYQSSTDAPFGTDRLVMAWDDDKGTEALETRTYGSMTNELTSYSVPVERGLIVMMFPYVLPMLVGLVVFSFSDARATVLEFNQRASIIQRRFNIGTPLSKYDWTNVDFQNFTLEQHSFTLTHHHSGDDNTSSSTSYSHHSGVNLTCTYEGGTHVLFFIEEKDNSMRSDLIENLFNALGVESPLNQSNTLNNVATEPSSQSEIRPPLVSKMPAQQIEEIPSDEGPEPSDEKASSGFWDQV